MAPRLPERAWHASLRGAWMAAGLLLTPPVAHAAETVIAAQFDGPTTRYAHAVLGDAIEYTELLITTQSAEGQVSYRFRLGEDHVFEDLAPRLWDITGDGLPEVVVVETDMARGASLAVYNQSGKIAQTPYIGQRHRWLAPIGAADLNGDGRIEVAFIDRPHLAKVLRVFAWDGAGLQFVAETDARAFGGLTNHRIGEDFISGGLRQCAQNPELGLKQDTELGSEMITAMITANGDWSAVMATRLTPDGVLLSRAIAPFSPEALAAALDDVAAQC